MARNEEKQIARLNRFYLKQQKDEYEKKNPRRPRLDELHRADDIKKWLPSIKRDIDFCLKQSQVPCYPQRKIDELNKRIDFLKKEYRAFVRKLREVNPNISIIPWTDRQYEAKKRKIDDNYCIENTETNKQAFSVRATQEGDKTEADKTHQDSEVEENQNDMEDVNEFRFIRTPVLNNSYQHVYGYTQKCPVDTDFNVNKEMLDKPLKFNDSKDVLSTSDKNTNDNKSDKSQPDSSQIVTKHSCGLHIPYSDSSDSDS